MYSYVQPTNMLHLHHVSTEDLSTYSICNAYTGIVMAFIWQLTQTCTEFDCQTTAVTQHSSWVEQSENGCLASRSTGKQHKQLDNLTLIRMTPGHECKAKTIPWLQNVEGRGTQISIWNEQRSYSCGATCLKDTLNWRAGREQKTFINFSKSGGGIMKGRLDSVQNEMAQVEQKTLHSPCNWMRCRDTT